MKAPDKVFFPNDINLLTKLSLVLKQKGDVCYIRKDALLEWAKEHKRVIETHGDERDAYLRGEYSALNSLIDKIESL